MTNSNCLAGIACPQCRNDFRIYIGVQALAEVTDDGAVTFGDMEWDADSYAECPDCHHCGRLGEFQAVPTTEPSTPTKEE